MYDQERREFAWRVCAVENVDLEILWPKTQETQAEREFVLKDLGNRTRTYHQSKKNALVDFVSGFASRSLLTLPPVTDQC